MMFALVIISEFKRFNYLISILYLSTLSILPTFEFSRAHSIIFTTSLSCWRPFSGSGSATEASNWEPYADKVDNFKMPFLPLKSRGNVKTFTGSRLLCTLFLASSEFGIQYTSIWGSALATELIPFDWQPLTFSAWCLKGLCLPVHFCMCLDC